MRERVSLANGTLDVDSGEHGTLGQGPACRHATAAGLPVLGDVSGSEQTAS